MDTQSKNLDRRPPTSTLAPIHQRAVDQVRALLLDETAPALIWVSGEPGSGRTTAVAAALNLAGMASPYGTVSGSPPPTPAQPDSGHELAQELTSLPVRRLQCLPGTHLGEVVEAIAELLAQSGSPGLGSALKQRTPLGFKLSLTFQALETSRTVLWLEDFEHLLLQRSGSFDEALVRAFLNGCGRLGSGRSRLIVTSKEAAPEASFATVRIPRLETAEAQIFWDHLCAQPAPEGVGALSKSDMEKLPAAWQQLPLTLAVAFRATAGGAIGNEEGRDDSASTLKELLDAVLTTLPEASQRSLLGLAAFPPEPSLQALREILESAEITHEVLPEDPMQAPVFAELRRHGLLEDGSWLRGQTGRPELHPALRQHLTQQAEETQADEWKETLAAAGEYYCRLAQKTQSPWDAVRSWCSFHEAGRYRDAYLLHRETLGTLLKLGHIDVARWILEETVATSTGTDRAVAMGNLAMTHKSTGNFSAAEQLYHQAHGAFLDAHDLVNAARTLHQLGNTHYSQGNYRQALKTYTESLELSEEVGEYAVAAATRIQVGNTLYQCGENEAALETYLYAAETLTAQEHLSMRAAVGVQIGQIYLEAKRHTEAEEQLEAAAASAEQCGDLRNLLKAQMSLALAARGQQVFEGGRQHYTAAAKTAAALGDVLEAATIALLSGELERESGRPTQALRHFRRARSYLNEDIERDVGTRLALDPQGLGRIRGKVDACEEELRKEIGEDEHSRIVQAIIDEELTDPAS